MGNIKGKFVSFYAFFLISFSLQASNSFGHLDALSDEIVVKAFLPALSLPDIGGFTQLDYRCQNLIKDIIPPYQESIRLIKAFQKRSKAPQLSLLLSCPGWQHQFEALQRFYAKQVIEAYLPHEYKLFKVYPTIADLKKAGESKKTWQRLCNFPLTPPAGLSENHCSFLIPCILDCYKPEDTCLVDNPLFDVILPWISTSSTLKEICLSELALTKDKALSFLIALEKSSIERLEFCGLTFKEPLIDLLCSLQDGARARIKKLSFSGFSGQTWFLTPSLAILLQAFPALEHLALYQMFDGLGSLALPHGLRLKRLEMINCVIDFPFLSSFSNQITHFTALKELKIGNSNLEDTAIPFLLSMKAQRPSLNLDCFHNHGFTEEGLRNVISTFISWNYPQQLFSYHFNVTEGYNAEYERQHDQAAGG